MDDLFVEQIIADTMPFYRSLAYRLASKAKLPDIREDLEAVATIAIWQSIAAFNPEIHSDFSKYCYLRVHGAMIDLLRKLGGKSRHTGKWYTIFSLDAPTEGRDGEFLIELMAPIAEEFPYNPLPADWEALLDEREKIIIQCMYWDGMPMIEVGRILGVNESRVSQLHKRCIEKLRSVLV